MLLWEIKDAVREHFARTDIPTTMLSEALKFGRRMVEEQGNWWWMRREVVWQTVINQRPYPFYVGSGAAPTVGVLTRLAGVADPGVVIDLQILPIQSILVPGFKDIRFLLTKETTDVEWTEMQTGGTTKEEADLHYSITEVGLPELAVLDNLNLHVYPAPDKTYHMILYYWAWTDNPVSNLQTDELINRFPEALIYAALTWAYEVKLKDFNTAQYWRALLLGNPVQRVPGEIQKIRRHNFLREYQDKIMLIPMKGPNERVKRQRISQSIYLGSTVR